MLDTNVCECHEHALFGTRLIDFIFDVAQQPHADYPENSTSNSKYPCLKTLRTDTFQDGIK